MDPTIDLGNEDPKIPNICGKIPEKGGKIPGKFNRVCIATALGVIDSDDRSWPKHIENRRR